MTNVIVFGAHGRVGQLLIKQIAKSSGAFKATAILRNQEQVKTINEISSNSSDIKTQILDYNSLKVKDLSEVIKGHDAVVFTAGSGGKDLLKVDLDGAVKTYEASILAAVKRVIVISAIHADNREFGASSGLHNYYIAKHYADRILIHELGDKLDYTILKPTALTNDPATGKVDLFKSIDEPNGSIPREDVARSILEVINNKATFGKSYDFKSGSTPISDVFN